MNIYKSRYINALKKAAKINQLIKRGYHVFHNGEFVKGGKFILRDDKLLFKSSENSYTCYFHKNADWDDGHWTRISEWNKLFNQAFEVYIPNAKIIL